jgi:putative peptide zinc metalloprotease protein
VTQQPRVHPNAAAEEAFVPLGGDDGAPAPGPPPGPPPGPKGGRKAGRKPGPDRPGRSDRPEAGPARPARNGDDELPERYRNEPVPRGNPPELTRAQRQMGVTAPARKDGSTATAADFTAERYLRDQSLAPRDGWRRAIYWLSGGRVNFGPGPSELAERELMARAKTPVPGCRSIAVISRKGGVGKTTTTLMLGHTFASLRGDRVVALDGNPDAGSLGYRVRRETAATITNLLADEQMITRYADIRAYTSQAPSRLEVVASDDDPRITRALGEEDYRRAIALLERHYNLICLDTGTGVLESATRGILQLADQIVVVMSPSLDSARAASSTLDWLNENGHSELVRSAVAVVNGVQADSLVEVDRIKEHFAGRCRAVVQVPWDPHLAAGAETDVTRLRPMTRHAYLEVAAAVADGFVT